MGRIERQATATVMDRESTKSTVLPFHLFGSLRGLLQSSSRRLDAVQRCHKSLDRLFFCAIMLRGSRGYGNSADRQASGWILRPQSMIFGSMSAGGADRVEPFCEDST